MVTLRLGWRNAWRNPRRSLLSVAAVAVAFAVLLTLESLRAGLTQQMLDSGTRLLLAHVQVHDGAYLPDRGFHDTLGGEEGTDWPRLLQALDAVPGVAASAPRVIAFALLSTGTRSAGAEILGVEPAREREVTSLLATSADRAAPADLAPGTVLLGATLAEELDAGAGSEIALVTQAADGSVGNALATVGGILRTGLAEVDRSLAVVPIADLQQLIALDPRRIHEVALRLEDPQHAAAVVDALTASGVLPAGARARSWASLAPALADYLRLSAGWSWVMIAIIGTFAAFGVLNTMLMAVFERTHEMGVLVALGLRPAQLLLMVVAESLALAATGLLAGAALGTAGVAYLAWHGWDLTRWAQGVTIAGVLIDPVLRGAWAWTAAPAIAAALAAITTAASLVPALRAARLRPVQALAASVES